MSGAAPRPAPRVLALAMSASMGCATASPMLVSPRVLPPARFELDVGTAYNTPVAETALSQAQPPGAPRDAVLRGAVGFAAQPAGVLPFVQGRTGLGASSEASVALIGRFLRIGARREFYRQGNWTITGGMNARLAFLASGDATSVPNLSLVESRVYGGELTLQGGYTRRDIYDAWISLRTGYLYGDGRAKDPTGGADPWALMAHRMELGFTVGLRIAWGHIGVGVELETQYVWTSGGDGNTTVHADFLALVPACVFMYRP